MFTNSYFQLKMARKNEARRKYQKKIANIYNILNQKTWLPWKSDSFKGHGTAGQTNPDYNFALHA